MRSRSKLDTCTSIPDFPRNNLKAGDLDLAKLHVVVVASGALHVEADVAGLDMGGLIYVDTSDTLTW